MARSISVHAKEAWRAVIVRKADDGNLWYSYMGLYPQEGTAKAQVSRCRRGKDFYDGWIERAEILWQKVKD